MAIPGSSNLQSAESIDGKPIAIGGMGGSGTRLIAQIYESLGFYLGDDLNLAHDNLLFTLLFKRENILQESTATINQSIDLLLGSLRDDQLLSGIERSLIASLAKAGRPHHPQVWLANRAKNIINKQIRQHRSLIAWKEPNTHVLLDHIAKHHSGTKYLHVMRDGLDMAYSPNQLQLELWGEYFLQRKVDATPEDALDYWNAIHTRIFEFKATYPNRIEVVSYDKICQSDPDELSKLFRFTDIQPSAEQLAGIYQLIEPPDTIGRAEMMPIENFSDEALKRYRQLMQFCQQA